MPIVYSPADASHRPRSGILSGKHARPRVCGFVVTFVTKRTDEHAMLASLLIWMRGICRRFVSGGCAAVRIVGSAIRLPAESFLCALSHKSAVEVSFAVDITDAGWRFIQLFDTKTGTVQLRWNMQSQVVHDVIKVLLCVVLKSAAGKFVLMAFARQTLSRLSYTNRRNKINMFFRVKHCFRQIYAG